MVRVSGGAYSALRGFVAVGLWLLVPNAAWATPVTVSFQGTVTSVHSDLSSAFLTGQTFTGTYVFEPTTAPCCGGPESTSYLSPLLSLTISFPSYSASAAGLYSNITIEDGQAVGSNRRDMYSLSAQVNGASIGAFNANQVNLTLSTLLAVDPSVLNSTALTQPVPDPSAFASTFFLMPFFNNDFSQQRNVTGVITSLQVQTVPDGPSTGWLLLLGFVGLLCLRPVARSAWLPTSRV